MMEISDQELLKNWCRQRDTLAFQAIVQRHATMVFHTALRILRNPSDAEDATQLCFEKLVKIDKTTNIRSLGAWLHGVATNLSISFIRTKSRRSKREEEYAEINCTTDDAK